MTSAGGVGQETSLVVDGSGKLHICYKDFSNDDLKYVTNITGSWVISALDSAGDVGSYTSMKMDSADNLHISYYNYTTQDLKYATNASGSWVTSFLDTSGFTGTHTSLAIDGSDNIHISYRANDGLGYAGGLDLFWRDTKSIPGGDYWISYSFLNTSRDYKDFPYDVAPHYASAHNRSLFYKHLITPITTFVGFTYSHASPRPYHDKNSIHFMDGRTKPYNDLSLNLTYLTRLFKNDCIIHMSINNLLGTKNVFGYNYSNTMGEDGQYASKAVVPTSGTQAVLLIMLSL